MALRGRKPKDPNLRAIDGSHRTTRHGDLEEVKEHMAQIPPLEMPDFLEGEARQAWKDHIEPAFWLDHSKLVPAVAFCALYAEFLDNPRAFSTSKHSVLRGYMLDLGLTDPRNRDLAKKGGNPKDPAEKYF